MGKKVDLVPTVGKKEENERLVERLRHVHPEAVGLVHCLQSVKENLQMLRTRIGVGMSDPDWDTWLIIITNLSNKILDTVKQHALKVYT